MTARLHYAFWLLGTAVLLLGGLYVLVAGARLPFGGYELLAYRAVPPAVCPETLLRLDARVLVDPPAYAKLGRYRLLTYWLNEQGGRTEAEEFVGSLANARPAPEPRWVESSVLRQAPAGAGNWFLVSEMRYGGTVLGYPRTALFSFTTSGPILETKDPDDPECLEAAREVDDAL